MVSATSALHDTQPVRCWRFSKAFQVVVPKSPLDRTTESRHDMAPVMASDPKNPHRPPGVSGPVPRLGRRPDIRAREAMEVLQRRGYGPSQSNPEPLQMPEARPRVGYPNDVWSPPHWTDTPLSVIDEELLEPEELPTPAAVENASMALGEETIPPAPNMRRPSVAAVQVDDSDPRFETEDDPRIPPNQEFFRIGEASRIVGVKPHVLRFWETEFDSIVPEKTRTNQRRYRRRDIVRLLQIRRLRHDAKLTVAQTRSILDVPAEANKSGGMEVAPNNPTPSMSTMERGELIQRLADMRRDVVELLEVVEDDAYR